MHVLSAGFQAHHVSRVEMGYFADFLDNQELEANLGELLLADFQEGVGVLGRVEVFL